MKNLLIFAALLLTACSATSQNSAADKLFDRYQGKEGYTTVLFTSGMLDLLSLCADEDKKLKEQISKITGLRILAVNETNPDKDRINFYREIADEIEDGNYKELMVVKSDGEDVKFLIREKNGMVSELLLVVGGSDNALICLQGRSVLKK